MVNFSKFHLKIIFFNFFAKIIHFFFKHIILRKDISIFFGRPNDEMDVQNWSSINRPLINFLKKLIFFY